MFDCSSNPKGWNNRTEFIAHWLKRMEIHEGLQSQKSHVPFEKCDTYSIIFSGEFYCLECMLLKLLSITRSEVVTVTFNRIFLG